MVAASRPEHLLTPDDIKQLQNVVESWERRLPASERGKIWDIEFGFVGGKLWLFQIRPFVRFRSSDLLERLKTLDRDVAARAITVVSLEEPI